MQSEQVETTELQRFVQMEKTIRAKNLDDLTMLCSLQVLFKIKSEKVK